MLRLLQVLGISIDPLLAQEVGAGFDELKAKHDLILAMGELMQLQRHQHTSLSFASHISEMSCCAHVNCVAADAGQVISDCEMTPATSVAVHLWIKAIDERSSRSSSKCSSIGRDISACCALIIARAFSDGTFSRQRRLLELKTRLEVSLMQSRIASSFEDL